MVLFFPLKKRKVEKVLKINQKKGGWGLVTADWVTLSLYPADKGKMCHKYFFLLTVKFN